MTILKVLLFPFSVLYQWITDFRNHLYDIGHKKSFQFEIPVISVGNLSVGGTGKTPMVEYLIRLLHLQYPVATLSRGYGRRTRGLRFANENDSSLTLGDEPYQIYRSFGDTVKVTVGEDRAFAIPNIIHEFPETAVILLDDAFQHRSVSPQFKILLTDFAKPFYSNYLLPTGTLRESRKGASRADAVVITKCDNSISMQDKIAIKNSIRRYAGHKPIFFSTIQYDAPVSFPKKGETLNDSVVLISGIANAKPFEDYAKATFKVIRHFRFGDHHQYTADEIRKIKDFIKQQGSSVSILTTEKDMVRLLDTSIAELLSDISCFYLPIKMVFSENGADFDRLVIDVVEKTHTS